MKVRIISLLLAAVLALTAPAAAAEPGAFARIRSYEDAFSDVPAESVFYDNVAALYEYGLTVGKADGTFGLTDPLTVGQIVIFAGRIRSLYDWGDAEAGARAYSDEDSGLAAVPYLRYLQAEGVLGQELDAYLDQPATRAQVAHVLARTLPEGALEPLNDAAVDYALDSGAYLQDVTPDTPYYADILRLYRWGVSGGSDAAGSFLPEETVTRGAAAAMLTRMVDPALRVTLTWEEAAWTSAAGTTLADLVEPGALISAPTTTAEMDESVRYMLSAGSNQLTLQYPGISMISARGRMEEALEVVKSYCEQGYNTVSCTVEPDGELTLTFSAAGIQGDVETYRTAALEAAIQIHDSLWSAGVLTPDMTETEIARVYYTWICENCTYDYGATDTSLSHIPYSLFTTGTAVCDGYTGAYNLLLKLEGIDCTALSNDSHIWTVAELDGTQVHIDTTWGDGGSAVDYGYFAMTPEQSWRRHAW